MTWIAVCILSVAPAFAQTAEVDALRSKAASGNAKAAYDLAKLYFEGKAVPEDPKQGLAWLERSAAEDYPGAQVTLGYFYQKGFKGSHGAKIKTDPHRAAEWYRKAASHPKTNSDQSTENARSNLAQMLAQHLISSQEADWHTSGSGSGSTKEIKSDQPKSLKPLPFSLSEVETGLSGGITTKRMATLVSTYGVDFTLSTSTRKRLADDGADDTLLQTIASSRR